MRNNRKGFTIVELVIVIAVIGILAAVLIPTFSGITDKANKTARLQETRNAMVEYMTENDGYIAEGTVFMYDDDTDYYFVYSDGKLTERNASDVSVEGYVAVPLSSKVSVYELAPVDDEPVDDEPVDDEPVDDEPADDENNETT